MRIDLPIEGMHCASCAANIERRLQREPGVEQAAVNFATQVATVEYAPEQTDVPRLIAAVRDAGYAVNVQAISFPVEGITCAGCVTRIERGLRRLPAVVEATVNFATRIATVSFLPGAVTAEELYAAVREIGYAVPVTEPSPALGVVQHRQRLHRGSGTKRSWLGCAATCGSRSVSGS